MKKFLLITAGAVTLYFGAQFYQAYSVFAKVDNLAERSLTAWDKFEPNLPSRLSAACQKAKADAAAVRALQNGSDPNAWPIENWLERFVKLRERAAAIQAFTTSGERCGRTID